MKLLNVILLPLYTGLFVLILTGFSALFQLATGIELDTTLSITESLTTYIYPAIFAISLMPFFGTMVELIWYVIVFEVALWVFNLIWKFLNMSNITNANPID